MPMDARELSQRIKTLTTSVQKNDPPADILAQLELIKKEPAPTEEILRSTKAGVVIAKLNKNADKDIAKVASDIVVKWRRSVEAEKKARAGKSHPSPSPAPATKPASPASKVSGGPKKKFEGDAEKRTFKTEGVDISRIGVEVRDSCIGLIYNGLAYRSYEPAELVLQRAMEVENAAFKLFKGASNDYKGKIRSLFQNLKGKTNAELGQSVISGDVTAERFVRMSGPELMSAEQRKITAELEKENMSKAQVPMAEKSVSEELTCGNCKQKKVSYTQAQTRSADEPMTTFCECMNCGKRWKFS
ncbi:putative Transcription elongation factor S-II [Seiridium cardinale]|uniref:Transcription elongation factor S-II n=1 Tax=Seiridium cardinale TaxID=138064 RepID=A0ABR2XUE0_9PEZI